MTAQFAEASPEVTPETDLDLVPFPLPAAVRPAAPAFAAPITLRDVETWFNDETADSDYRRYVNPYLGALLAKLRLDKQFVRGEGCELYDNQGRQYLDCISAYGALPFGFNPPEIWKALKDVEANAEPSFIQPSLLGPAGELARKLLAIAPEGLRYVTFANSGAEAVEAAIKMCRLSTGRQGILSTYRSFHGKTLGALSATGNADYQEGSGAPTADFDSIPYGDAEALRLAFATRPDHYAAFIVEPIQGEGGIVEPPAGYLAEVRRICTNAGVLLVFDEIQSGLGRAGSLFCCEQEGATPDVMTLAKALGGGLMPIGAVLANEEAYSERFALKHSSTFAGNALACRAGIAALDMLTRDRGFLLQRVALYGARLKLGLSKLQKKYPQLIEEVRGRGFLLGIKFTNKRNAWPDGLLGVSAEQSLLTPIFSSYMLNVEGVRVAPTLNGGAVVRIEPALNIRWHQCQKLLAALERTLEVFAEGDMGRILGSIFDGAPRKSSREKEDVYAEGDPTPDGAIPPEQADERKLAPRENETRFGFLAHPLMFENYTEFDPSLGSLSEDELELVSEDLVDLVEPFVRTKTRVVSKTGKTIYGEFVMLPWTADQWKRMRRKEASDRVVEAVQLAGARGAQIVGLGAFTSIVTAGGTKCEDAGVAVTTGNSYTAVASAEAIGIALEKLGQGWSGETSVAIVGAAGAIGRAMALLLAENVGKLMLVGNPDSPPAQVRERLLAVAADVCRHLEARRSEGAEFLPGTWGDRVIRLVDEEKAALTERDWSGMVLELEAAGALVITQDIKSSVRGADVVVTATSATECILEPADLRRGAVVCDLSRPANVSAATAAQRPDVLVIDGGVIAAPGNPYLGNWGLGHGLAFACMAETMMLALEDRLENTSLGVDLRQETLRYFQSASKRHGFAVARLRSFGKILSDADWQRVIEARKAA